MVRRLRVFTLCTFAAAVICCLSGCGAATSSAANQRPDAEQPGRSVHETLRRAIALLEAYKCETFAVEFLSPIKRQQIKDLDAYRKGRACSAQDRGNLDDVLMAMRLALGAQPTVSGVKATIDLSGIGLRITKLEFVRYVDGRWYFNEL
jgi:hypothetical protein